MEQIALPPSLQPGIPCLKGYPRYLLEDPAPGKQLSPRTPNSQASSASSPVQESFFRSLADLRLVERPPRLARLVRLVQPVQLEPPDGHRKSSNLEDTPCLSMALLNSQPKT